MAEPRQPQRQQPKQQPQRQQPQPRQQPQRQQPQKQQPKQQPQRQQPQKPATPPAKADDRIDVGDPGAAAARSLARPIRPLAPDAQAPPVEAERKVRKGEVYWVMGSEELPRPRKGRIVRLSNEPGKAVGVEFGEPVGGYDEQGQPWGAIHTCDGRGKEGHCLYVRPDQILDDRAMEAHEARLAERLESIEYEEYDELTVGPQHSQPISPPPLGLPGPEEEYEGGETYDASYREEPEEPEGAGYEEEPEAGYEDEEEEEKRK